MANFRSPVLKTIGAFTVVVLGCVTLYLFVDGTYWLNQPCRPISYADGRELTKTYTPEFYTTKDSLETIILFYNQKLRPESASEKYYFEGDHGVWTEQKIADEGYIYRCIGKQINGDIVRGCIYIYKEGDSNTIETAMYLSSEELPSCRSSLSLQR